MLSTFKNVYVNEVLAHIVVPFMRDNFLEGNGILQQDGARPHTARVTQQFIADNNISLLNWVLMSPDMYPIEHVWDGLCQATPTRKRATAEICRYWGVECYSTGF